MSLIAVAAVAASLLIARQREEPVQLPIINGGDDLPAERSLAAIRAAGL